MASSSLPISYSSSDPTTAEIVGIDGDDLDSDPDPGTHKIRIRKAGTVTITANQAGNAIYNPAPCSDADIDHQLLQPLRRVNIRYAMVV